MSIGSITAATAATGIEPLGALRATTPTASAQGTAGTDAMGFGEYLQNALEEVNALQQASSDLTEDFIAGRTDSIHEVMIAGEKASLSLQLVLEIRNKVLEAYQEINRMQI